MGKYVGDILWPTVLLIAIVVPVFLTYMPYITTGQHYDIATSITQTLTNSLNNPASLASTYLLGDLAPYLYIVLAAMIIVNRRRLGILRNELGFSWKPLLGVVTIPAILLLALLWFLVSGVIPLTILPGISMTNILVLTYTLYPIAISEEIVFRGFMLNRLLPHDETTPQSPGAIIINSLPAVMISAVYFTLAHVPVYLAVYGLDDVTSVVYILSYIFIYGVISGVIFIMTRNVIPDILIHWINDYVSIILILYPTHVLGLRILTPIF